MVSPAAVGMHAEPAARSYHQIWRDVALPRKINFVSLEVYGTLIDWETGIFRAFEAEASKDGFTIDRDELIPLFLETQREIMAGSYELYAEVLRRVAVKV